MQKLVLIYGIIAGLIIAVLGMAARPLWMDADGNMDMKTGEIIGYLTMIVSLSMVYVGTRSYRDKHLDGKITFGKAFKVGILITLVASAIYVAGWMIYFHSSETAQKFPEQYLNYMVEQMQDSGKQQAEIDKEIQHYTKNMELYKNPVIMIGVTLLEIFPVGLIISLISSLILKRKA